MAASRPLFTRNFSSNLTDIQDFLGTEGAAYFAGFFERFVDEVVPNACRFPRSGRSFLERAIRSREAERLVERLSEQLRKNDELRELIVDDFLVLYLVRGERIVFLSIKQHRQLSYDLKAFWRD